MQETPPESLRIDLDAPPYVPKYYTKLVEHRPGGQFDFDPSKLALYVSERQPERPTGPYAPSPFLPRDLAEEIQRQPVLNANLLDWFLLPGNDCFIPEAWMKIIDQGGYICFWGTTYLDEYGKPSLRALHFNTCYGLDSYDVPLDYENEFYAWYPAAVWADASSSPKPAKP